MQTVRVEAVRFSNQAGRWIEGPQEQVAIITYDGRGNKTEVVSGQTDIKGLFEGLPTGKTVYTYDDQGRLDEMISYDSDGSSLGTTAYIYDDKGLLTKTISYSRDGSPYCQTPYEYDAQGRLTAQLYGCANKIAYLYDPRGNLTEEIFYSPSSSIHLRLVHAYDARGHRISTTSHAHHDPGLGIEKVVTTYDAKGNILEQTTYYTQRADEPERPVPPPAKMVYTYEFEGRGNWIKQTQTDCYSETGKPVCEPSLVTYRTITYYSQTAGQ